MVGHNSEVIGAMFCAVVSKCFQSDEQTDARGKTDLDGGGHRESDVDLN